MLWPHDFIHLSPTGSICLWVLWPHYFYILSLWVLWPHVFPTCLPLSPVPCGSSRYICLPLASHCLRSLVGALAVILHLCLFVSQHLASFLIPFAWFVFRICGHLGVSCRVGQSRELKRVTTWCSTSQGFQTL